MNLGRWRNKNSTFEMGIELNGFVSPASQLTNDKQLNDI